jgi:hypothetical protein
MSSQSRRRSAPTRWSPWPKATLRGDQPDRPPVEVMLHIDAASLTGELEGVGVSAETSRRLLCDAGVVPVRDDAEGHPLDVGRKLRLFSGALRRALLARDGRRCRFPGCTHARYLHGHHVRHWIDGGETSLANALLLCSRHHRLVHEGRFHTIAVQDGVRFLSPDGRDLSAKSQPHPVALPAITERQPTWDGHRVDYGDVLECLMA